MTDLDDFSSYTDATLFPTLAVFAVSLKLVRILRTSIGELDVLVAVSQVELLMVCMALTSAPHVGWLIVPAFCLPDRMTSRAQISLSTLSAVTAA